jgi:hypothetical protein
LQGTIRPVVSQRIRGESESIRPVNANTPAPRYRAVKSGQLAGNQHPPRGLAVFFWEVSAPKSGSEFGEPGETTIRPVIAVAKAPQCPQSVDAPLSPGKSRQIAESTIRPVTGVAGAPLPHQRPQFHSRSGRYIRIRQPAGAPLRQAWNVNTEGNCIRERARAGITLRRSVTSDGTVPLTGQLRPQW